MSTIERTFFFHDVVHLPVDTLLLRPTSPGVLPPAFDNTCLSHLVRPPDPAHFKRQPHKGIQGKLDELSTEAAGMLVSLPTVTAGCSCSSIAAKEGTIDASDVVDKTLLVSTSAASYVVIDRELEPAIRSMIAGLTLSEVFSSLRDMSRRTAKSKVRRLLKQLVMRNFLRDAEVSEYIPSGAILHFYVTNRCNLRCQHCYMSSGLPLPNGELTPEQRRNVILTFSQLYPHGTVTFSGGEPLLVSDIYDLLRLSKEAGLRVELFTNGLLVDKTNISVLVDNVDLIQVSLDGATKAVNDATRGNGTFERILATIRLLDEAVVDRNLSYRLAFTLTPDNWSDIKLNLPDLIKTLALKGSHRISIGSGSNLGRATGNRSLYSTVEEMRKMEADIIHHLAKQGVYKFPLFSTNRFSRSCGMGGAIGVAADGSIYPCTITDQPPMGNVLDSNAPDIMKAVAGNVVGMNVDNIDGCNRCPIRYMCGGLCRITNLSRTGSYYVSGCTSEYKESQVRNLIRRYQTFELVTE